MRKRVLFLISTSLLVLVLVSEFPVLARQNGHGEAKREHQSYPGHSVSYESLEVGKKGEVDFAVTTVAGDLRLEPGRYRLQHRGDAREHSMQFVEITRTNPYTGTRGLETSHPGTVECSLESLEAKASRTEIHMTKENGIRRVTKVIVSGEDAAHLF